MEDIINKTITEELRKRCINVDLTVTYNTVENKINITSTEFNTIPVLHSPITIESWNSYVKTEVINEITWITAKIGVYASYAGNGVELFSIKIIMFKRLDHFTFSELTIN